MSRPIHAAGLTPHALWRGLAIGLLASAGAAAASDEIGLFFDEKAELPCLRAEAFTTPTAYLLLLDPSASGGVYGWECTLDYTSVMLIGSPAISGVGLNVASPPEFQVGLGAPLPRAPVVKLASLQFLLLDRTAAFYIYPFRQGETPQYADGSDPSILLPMTPRGMAGGALVAGVNLPECITVDATWGRIKHVYGQ
ncbi:MAG: hypothetical protein ACYDIE_08680 [Candidatus Krumholzibacteriia bacterium]